MIWNKLKLLKQNPGFFLACEIEDDLFFMIEKEEISGDEYEALLKEIQEIMSK